MNQGPKKLLPVMLPKSAQHIAKSNIPSRQWIVTPIKKWNDLAVGITMKIRGEEATSFVPEKLYSSHKYVIEQAVTGQIVDESNIIVCHVQILHTQSEQEILKDGKPIVVGILDTALTRDGEGQLIGTLRVQFTEVSYHYDKGSFMFKLSYCDPSNMNDPIMIIKSPPFRVFARKPSIGHETLQPDKTKEIIKKRKRDDDDDKPKHSKMYQEFQKKLEVLVQMKGNLSEEDKKLANETSLEKLLVIDPTSTVDLFLKNNVNIQM